LGADAGSKFHAGSHPSKNASPKAPVKAAFPFLIFGVPKGIFDTLEFLFFCQPT
jgi:hypothetical protein